VGDSGPVVARFEELFRRARRRSLRCCDLCARRRCISRWCWRAVGPGDEVICPSYTFIATATPSSTRAATPVFADIERDMEHRSGGCARAGVVADEGIVPVHQVGLAGFSIVVAGRSRGVSIVEDAAARSGDLQDVRRIAREHRLL